MLSPGSNTLYLNGSISPAPSALPAASAFFSAYLNGLPGSATCVGENVTLPGGLPTPPWLLAAVRNLTLTATMPGVVNLTLMTDLAVQSLGIEFPSTPPSLEPGISVNPLMSGAVSARLHLPFDIPVNVYSVNVSLTFVDIVSNKAMALLEAPNQPGSFTPCGENGVVCNSSTTGNAPEVGEISMIIGPAILHILDDDLFGQLLKVRCVPDTMSSASNYAPLFVFTLFRTRSWRTKPPFV